MNYLLLLVLLIAPVAAGAVEFSSLTSIPAFDDIQQTFDLSSLLNAVYRICIGLAASLAVVQLIRAGILYMGGDSVTNKKEGKDLIVASLFGLLLVLSPVIVFGIINPDILSLRIDASGLGGNGSAEADPSLNQFDEDSCAQYTDVEAYEPPPADCDSLPSPPFPPACDIYMPAECSDRAGGEGSFSIPPVCCAGISGGALCCGRNE